MEDGCILAASEAIQVGRASVLATVIGAMAPPSKSGARMLIYGDGQTVGSIGGGSLNSGSKPSPRRSCRPAMHSGTAPPTTCRWGLCRRHGDLHQPLSVRPQLYLFGSGHVAYATVPFGSNRLWVHVIDDRAESCSRRNASRVSTATFRIPSLCGGACGRRMCIVC